MKKKISFLLTLVLALSFLVGCTDKDSDLSTLEKIEKDGVLTLGTTADYPPYEFHALIDGEDQIVGFDIELAKYIAEDLGVELEIKEMDFKNLIGGLSSGMVDIVIAGLSPDPERDINFSDIYYKASHGVLVKKGNDKKISIEEDLKGKKIGVQMGTIQETIAEDIEDADLTVLPLVNNLIMELQTDKIDAIIMEKPVAESYAKSNENLILVEGIEIEDAEGGSVVGIKKDDDELTEKINEILSQVREKDLIEKWLIEANEIQEKSGIDG